MNPRLKIPAGRRVTTRLAARQVRRRHRIMVIRATGVVPALFSQVVMTCRLAQPARTGRRGEGGSVLMLLHSPGLRCRLLRRGHGPGQFLAADPDGGDRDEQGEQPDPRGNNERTGKPTVRA